MSTLAVLTSDETGANSLIDINDNFDTLNTDKKEQTDIDSSINTHKAIQTGIHGLVITASKTLTVTDNTTLGGGATSGNNSGDQTLPVKAAGSELDTASDDAKFATAKAIKDAHNVPSVVPGTAGNLLTSDGTDWTSATSSIVLALASVNLKYSADTERQFDTGGGSFVLKKSIVVNIPGVFRVKFDMKTENGANTANGQIWKSGVAYGTVQTKTGDTNYTTYSEDLYFCAGDKIEGRFKNSSSNGDVKNFRIYFDTTSLINGSVVTD